MLGSQSEYKQYEKFLLDTAGKTAAQLEMLEIERRALERSRPSILGDNETESATGRPSTYSIDRNGHVNLGDVSDQGSGRAIFTYTDCDTELRFVAEESKGIGTFERTNDGSVQFAFTGTMTEASAYQGRMRTYKDAASLDEDPIKVSTARLQQLLDLSFPGNMKRFPGVLGVGPNGTNGVVDRSGFADQLADDDLVDDFCARLDSEVGSQGLLAQIAFTETIFNRASCRGWTIRKTISGGYFPTPDPNPNHKSGTARQKSIIDRVFTDGLNITKMATGNASQNVGVGFEKYSSRGERFGIEFQDAPKLNRIKFGPPQLRPIANESTLRTYSLYVKSVLLLQSATLTAAQKAALTDILAELDARIAEAVALKTGT